MVELGAEIGQKMRSAIKAKLTELDCYVDDELPDYIMVMVANKRSKTQMNEDLNLFLNKKTSTFVDWLHIVLKKLKEVTVTNLEVYKKAFKRKSSHSPTRHVKKEKKVKKEKIVKQEKPPLIKEESLTDDLPLKVNSLYESRKVTIVDNPHQTFDIPSISDVDRSNLNELEVIERQIESVKHRLGMKIYDDIEEKDIENNQVNTEEVEANSETSKRPEHTKIVFSKSDFETPPSSPSKKQSALKRLGYYETKNPKPITSRLGKIDSSWRTERKPDRNEDKQDLRKGLSKYKDTKKLLSSKITIPQLDPHLLEDTFKKREVVSVVKVKPRVLPPKTQQANKNLLLKAVAEAEKSVSQIKSTRKIQPINKPTKTSPILPKKEDKTLNAGRIITVETIDETPPPKSPSPIPKKQQFIVTLDGFRKTDVFDRMTNNTTTPEPKRPHSPIVFNNNQETPQKPAINKPQINKIPDKLPIVPIKPKEKCWYYPVCRNGEKCEFYHPTKNCEQFPYCKFGDKCLYIHPVCKFGSFCTKRNCPFVHAARRNSAITKSTLGLCKYYPNCGTLNCPYVHPQNHKFKKVIRT